VTLAALACTGTRDRTAHAGDLILAVVFIVALPLIRARASYGIGPRSCPHRGRVDARARRPGSRDPVGAAAASILVVKRARAFRSPA